MNWKKFGFVVFEGDTPMRLAFGDRMPRLGVLVAGEDESAHVFPTHELAQKAVDRTYCYEMAFNGDSVMKRFCKIYPVAIARKKS